MASLAAVGNPKKNSDDGGGVSTSAYIEHNNNRTWEEIIQECQKGNLDAVRGYLESDVPDKSKLLQYFSSKRKAWCDRPWPSDQYESMNCLMAAVLSENIELVKYLLKQKGQNVAAHNADHLNVLHFAANFNKQSTSIMGLLLSSSGASEDEKDAPGYFCNKTGFVGGGWTPLDVALSATHNVAIKESMVRLMKENGCFTAAELRVKGYRVLCTTDGMERPYVQTVYPPHGLPFFQSFDTMRMDRQCMYAFMICVDLRLSMLPGGVMRPICKHIFDLCAPDVTSCNMLKTSFEDMGLNKELLRGVYACGFETPSTAQQGGIFPQTRGWNVVHQSQSGTGKTAAHAIACLHRLDLTHAVCQAIVVGPTRELMMATQNVYVSLGDYLQVRVMSLVGGVAVDGDIRRLKEGVHVVTGTPDRVLDMIRRGALSVDHVQTLVVDEADQMFSRGLKEQVHDIRNLLPQTIQTCLYSAMMPHDVVEFVETSIPDAVRILVTREEYTLDGIKQFFVDVEQEEWKLDTLCDLYETLTILQSIVYCNNRRKVEWLTEKMISRDFFVCAMHGDMDQQERDLIMREFHSGSSRILITTDLMAPGMDELQVRFLLNYDLPTNCENYIHRIGRSHHWKRFMCKAVAVSFVTTEDVQYLRDIEQFYSTQIEEMPMDLADFLI
jgi:translation initiation factor 4A